MSSTDADAATCQALVETVMKSGVRFVLHEHKPTHTVEDARGLPFDVTRIVKTVAFRAAGARIVLVAVRGSHRVDYAKLAGIVGAHRRELTSLSREEVRDRLGVEPGSVSPVPLRPDAVVLIDQQVLTVLPTLYCGIGRCDRTLEIAPADLVLVTRGRVAAFSRQATDR